MYWDTISHENKVPETLGGETSPPDQEVPLLISGCSAKVRRRSDMRTHLKTIHERDPQWVEIILEKCQSLIRENRGYIDPGLFIYKGAVVDPEQKPLGSIKGLLVDLNSKPDSGEMPSTTPSNSAEEPEPSPTLSNSVKQPESKRRKMSTEEYWNSRQPRDIDTHPDLVVRLRKPNSTSAPQGSRRDLGVPGMDLHFDGHPGKGP
jgi:hypothetical protein